MTPNKTPNQRRAIFLRAAYTQQLLNFLQDSRATGGTQVSDGTQFFNLTTSVIKAELKTREHVPNKAEKKAARQKKAKQKSKGGKNGRRNR